MYGASGNCALSSGTIGPFGPLSKLVVRTVGRLKNLAMSPRASTLFLNSLGEKSWTSEIRPVWWSTNNTTASSLFKRLYGTLLMKNSLMDGCRLLIRRQNTNSQRHPRTRRSH
ncbi:hypothetical protein D9M71_662320 [compost metagenome]